MLSCSLLLVEESLPTTCRTDILRFLSILDAGGWNCFANLSCFSVSVILVFLTGASVPADEVPVLSGDTDSVTPTKCVAGVTTFNDSELSSDAAAGVFNDQGNMFSARSRTFGQVGLTVNPIIFKDFCR